MSQKALPTKEKKITQDACARSSMVLCYALTVPLTQSLELFFLSPVVESFKEGERGREFNE